MVTWNNVQPPNNTCVHCAQSSQYHRSHMGPILPHAAYLHLRKSPYLANFSRVRQMSSWLALIFLTVGMVISHITTMSSVSRIHKPIRLMPVPPVLHWNLKLPTNVPVDDGGDLIVSTSIVRRCYIWHCSLPQSGRLSPGTHCTEILHLIYNQLLFNNYTSFLCLASEKKTNMRS